MRILCSLTAILALGMCTTAAYGDGGSILLHQDAGAFTITLFAAPQPMVMGTADLSVMVQDRATGAVLLDPEIDVTAGLAAEAVPIETIRLARANAANRLLQAASVPLPKAGNWRLTVRVHRGNDVVQVSTEVTVEPDTSRTTLIWFYVLLPVVAIAIFLLHQGLKNRGPLL